LNRVRFTDDAHFDFAWPRAVAQFDPWDCQNFFSNRFFRHFQSVNIVTMLGIANRPSTQCSGFRGGMSQISM